MYSAEYLEAWRKWREQYGVDDLDQLPADRVYDCDGYDKMRDEVRS